MEHYFAIVHKEKDSAFGVEFPDLPGCFSAADDLDNVVLNAREALALWFEDEEAKAPSSLEEITRQAAEALKGGAFVIAVPHLTRSGQSKRINVSMDSGLIAAIDGAAERSGTTRSAYLSQAAEKALEKA